MGQRAPQLTGDCLNPIKPMFQKSQCIFHFKGILIISLQHPSCMYDGHCSRWSPIEEVIVTDVSLLAEGVHYQLNLINLNKFPVLCHPQ